MTDTKTAKGPLRYRLYFWLMDAALIAAIVVWANYIVLLATGINGFGLPLVLQYVLAIPLWPLFTVVPIFLLLAKFMRDEYAELLWRRTVVVLAYALAIIPLAIVLFAWAIFYATGQPEDPPAAFAWTVAEVTWGYAIWAAWTFFMQLFVFIFQFIRWRDSR